MAAPNLTRVESCEDLLARLEEMPSVELEAYAMEALTLTTLLTSVLERRFPEQYHQWIALVRQAIATTRRGDGPTVTQERQR